GDETLHQVVGPFAVHALLHDQVRAQRRQIALQQVAQRALALLGVASGSPVYQGPLRRREGTIVFAAIIGHAARSPSGVLHPHAASASSWRFCDPLSGRAAQVSSIRPAETRRKHLGKSLQSAFSENSRKALATFP